MKYLILLLLPLSLFAQERFEYTYRKWNPETEYWNIIIRDNVTQKKYMYLVPEPQFEAEDSDIMGWNVTDFVIWHIPSHTRMDY